MTTSSDGPWRILAIDDDSLIATLVVGSIALAFTGLIVVLPLLGHASWHLYRRVVE